MTPQDYRLEIVIAVLVIVFLIVIGLILYFWGFDEVSAALNQGFTK
jgi:preprotein translocase subunit SecE